MAARVEGYKRNYKAIIIQRAARKFLRGKYVYVPKAAKRTADLENVSTYSHSTYECFSLVPRRNIITPIQSYNIHVFASNLLLLSHALYRK
jgi:hypothetical protein